MIVFKSHITIVKQKIEPRLSDSRIFQTSEYNFSFSKYVFQRGALFLLTFAVSILDTWLLEFFQNSHLTFCYVAVARKQWAWGGKEDPFLILWLLGGAMPHFFLSRSSAAHPWPWVVPSVGCAFAREAVMQWVEPNECSGLCLEIWWPTLERRWILKLEICPVSNLFLSLLSYVYSHGFRDFYQMKMRKLKGRCLVTSKTAVRMPVFHHGAWFHYPLPIPDSDTGT